MARVHAARKTNGVAIEVRAPTEQRRELIRRNLLKWLEADAGAEADAVDWEQGVVSEALLKTLLTVEHAEPPAGAVAARQAGAVAVVVRAPEQAEELGRQMADLVVHRLRRSGLESYLVV